VGLPYFNPHSIRKTPALLGERLCHSAEQMKAWSQNFGHDNVGTTFSSYGKVSLERQREIIGMLSVQPLTDPKLDMLVRQIIVEAQRKIS
jgi:hypothetical protein